jgi:L-ribulose-5-phosphate 3-epimerase
MQRVIGCLISWDGRFAPARLEMLRRAGIEYVQLLLDDRMAAGDDAQSILERLDDALTRAGLRLSSGHLGGVSPLDAEAYAQLERKLDLAHRLGIEVVVAPAGFADSDEEYRRILDRLRRLGDRAASYGITLALDTQPGLMQNWRSMSATIEQLEHPRLRVNFDPGNLVFHNSNADAETSLARITPLIAHVHLHDATAFSMRAYGALGRGGAVDFFRIRELLDVCGFTGPYGLVLDQDPDRPEPTDQEYARQLEESMENLRWCGYLD